MKLKATILSLLISQVAIASMPNVINKIQNKVTEFERQLERSPETGNDHSWRMVDEREADFWKQVNRGYDYLMKNQQKERYNFLFGATTANASAPSVRIGALEAWSSQANKRVYSLGLSYKFYEGWKAIMEDIKGSLQNLKNAKSGNVPNGSTNRATLLDAKNFLTEMSSELRDLKPETRIETRVVEVPMRTQDRSSKVFNSIHYAVIAFTGLCFFSIGLLVRRREDHVSAAPEMHAPLNVEETAADMYANLPPLPTEELNLSENSSVIGSEAPTQATSVEVHNAIDAQDNVMAQNDLKSQGHSQIPKNFVGVSLEEECLKTLKNNEHLLQISKINLQPQTRSPFKTDVDVSPEKIQEALQWLLKGTLAVANTNNGRTSHLEWNCYEKAGRVSIDFILHGIECDTKALSKNALLDGTNSASAHFGRTETTLSNNLPVVGLRSGHKKTIVSLGIDAFQSRMDH